MSKRVKRGLGLVVVAVIALAVAVMLGAVDASSSNEFVDIAGVLVGWVTVLSGLGGLVLIAVGLLRD